MHSYDGSFINFECFLFSLFFSHLRTGLGGELDGARKSNEDQSSLARKISSLIQMREAS